MKPGFEYPQKVLESGAMKDVIELVREQWFEISTIEHIFSGIRARTKCLS